MPAFFSAAAAWAIVSPYRSGTITRSLPESWAGPDEPDEPDERDPEEKLGPVSFDENEQPATITTKSETLRMAHEHRRLS